MKYGMKAAIAAIMFAVSLPSVASAEPHRLTIGQGVLEGDENGGVISYKGIPYAAAPTGENRWRPPQPAPSWTGVRDAATFGSDCAQAPFPYDSAPSTAPFAEDCLFLNVWQPASANSDDAFPVMVWIHGGGFVNGGSSPVIYSGENFARDGIVLVSLNYRLGRFGFFAHPALADEGFGANFGFLDQIAALRWVRDNIAAFGGDPDNVTVFGESAGGMSVHMLLQAPAARGLFHRAIIQSGGGRHRLPPMGSIAQGAMAGQAFAPGLSAEELRALPAERVTGQLSMMTMNDPGYSGPMIDGVTILGSGLQVALAGMTARVPLIVGANSADGFPMTTDKDAIFAAFGEDEAEARRLYDPNGDADGTVLATATSADQMFIESARAVARALAARQPVFLYRFDYATDGARSRMGGAPHASEIPYVFDTVEGRLGDPRQPEEEDVAALTHRYWVNFARDGRPDSDSAPAWPAVTPDDNDVQLITGDGAAHAPDPLQARLDFTERRATSAGGQ